MKKIAALSLVLWFTVAACSLASTAPSQFDGLIGLTAGELHQRLGQPDYIRVYDYGLGDRYAYFTPEEWDFLKDAAPQTPGDDVYIQSIANNALQYHITYTPVYIGADKRQPTLYVNEYTIYTNSPLRLGDLPRVLPLLASITDQLPEAYLRINQPPYLPVLVMQASGNQADLAKLFRRFRQRGDLNVQIEIGLQGVTNTTALGPDATVGYVIVRAGILDKSGSTAVPLSQIFTK